jgi:hypothetical protein
MASFPQKLPLARLRSASMRSHLFHLVRSMGKRAGVAAALLICGVWTPARAFREITSSGLFVQPANASRCRWEARIIA